jgi:hypothetical protein
VKTFESRYSEASFPEAEIPHSPCPHHRLTEPRSGPLWRCVTQLGSIPEIDPNRSFCLTPA